MTFNDRKLYIEGNGEKVHTSRSQGTNDLENTVETLFDGVNLSSKGSHYRYFQLNDICLNESLNLKLPKSYFTDYLKAE